MSERHVVRGVLAGVVGGLVASWVMNEFLAGPGEKLKDTFESVVDRALEKKQQEATGGEDSTMKVADAVASVATGGRHLTWEQRKKGGPMVHYAFGAAMGGLYGGLAEYSSAVRAGLGTTFGSALFAGADLVAVPALKLSGPPTEEPPASVGSHYAAHVVYGVTTEIVRRVVRAIL